MAEKITNPKQARVQLNVQVPWQEREQLMKLAKRRKTSLSALVRGTLRESLMEFDEKSGVWTVSK